MLEKISRLVSAARGELRLKKKNMAIKLLNKFMLEAEKAERTGDAEGLKKALDNQARLEAMNVRDVLQFVEKK